QSLLLTNQSGGVIDANVSGKTLSLDVGSYTNQGLIEATSGGVLIVEDAVTGSGSAVVTNGGTLAFTASFQQNVQFSGAGTLKLAQAYAGALSSFAVTDEIDLTSVAFSAGERFVFQSTTNGVQTYAVEGASGNVLTSLSFAGQYAAGDFTLANDGSGELLLGLAPTLAITSTGVLTNQTTQTISGTIDAADSGLTVSIYDGTTLLGTVKPAANGNWTKSVVLLSTQGVQAITARATDAAGNVGTSNSVTYTLDTIDPTLAITNTNTLTNQTTQTISGTIDSADARLTVSIYDGGTLIGTATPAAGGNWSASVTLLSRLGAQAIAAQATDAAGNVGTSNIVTYTLDTPPTITGTVAGQATTSDVPIAPFSNVMIADANPGATERLTITVGGAGGTLADGASFTGVSSLSGSDGSYTLSGTASAITAELDDLVFTPTAGAPNTTSTTTLTLNDLSSIYGSPTVDSTTTVVDSDPAVAPTITGATTTETASEKPITPFSHVTIGDANNGGTDTDTLSIMLSGGGALADGASFTGASSLSGSDGAYTLSGTAAAITSELDALSFTPVDGDPNSSVTTTFTLSDSSSAFTTPTVDSTTTVTDSDQAVAPTIEGTVAGQTTNSEAAIDPFSTVTIGDLNVGATDTLTITIGGAGGTLADGKDFSGLMATSASGVYTLSGTASAITSELDALTFTPTAGEPYTISTSTFALSDESSAYATPTANDATTVVDSDAATSSVILTIATAVEYQKNVWVIHVPSGDTITVADTAANIAAITQAQATALKVAGYASIGSTDGAVTLSVAAAQILSGDGLKVTGAAAIVDAYNAAGTLLSTVTSAATLTAEGYELGALDTAADIEASTATQIAGLLALHVKRIAASDTSVALSAAQATALETAGIVVAAPTGDKVTLSDTAANIEKLSAAQIAALSGIGVASVTLTGASNVVSAAQAEALTKLNGFALGAGAKLTVADNATDLLNGAYAAGLAVATAATLTGTANSVNAAQAEQLAGLTGFTLGSGAKLAVSDNAADLLSSSYAAGVSKATSVTLTGTFNGVSAAQAETLTKLNGFALASGATLAVADSAADLLNSAYAAGLAKATSATLTGSNGVSAAQAEALTKLKGFTVGSGASLAVSDSAANLLASANAAGVKDATSVTLTGANSETAAQAEALAKLNGFALGAGAKLVVSDSAADLLNAAYAAGLAEATGVTLTGTSNVVSAPQAEQLAGLTDFALGSGAKLTVSDSAADLLNAAYAAGLADATSVTLTGSNAEDAAQAEALAMLKGFTLGSGAKLAVSDNATNLLAGANAAGVKDATGVTLTGSNIDVTATEAAALAKLKGFSLASGASLAVSDSAADLLNSAYAAGLAKATSVTLTGSNSVNAAQAETLAKLNDFTLGAGATLAVSDNAADLLNKNNAAGLADATSVTLKDTAADIEKLTPTQIAALAGLGVKAIAATNASVLLTVAQATALETDGLAVSAPSGDVVTLSDTAAHVEALTPAQISDLETIGVAGIAATGASLALNAADAAAIETAGLTVSAPRGDTVSVSDTAANVAADQSPLSALAASGEIAWIEQLNTDGSHTFGSIENGTTIAGTGEDDTFVFAPAFGHDVIANFAATGTNHDVLEFSASSFSYMNSTMSQAEDLNALLSNGGLTSPAAGAMITDTAGDTLTLDRVAKATLALADFKFA
ncbi:MAG: Ig-like domain-containing protein, partial [Roseiarcus sp.]